MANCFKCGKELEKDEVAIYLKLVNRGATEYMCIDCLADYYQVSRKAIEDKIKFIKESGKCMLFQ